VTKREYSLPSHLSVSTTPTFYQVALQAAPFALLHACAVGGAGSLPQCRFKYFVDFLTIKQRQKWGKKATTAVITANTKISALIASSASPTFLI
jgi:hypothetical protein